MPGSTRISVDLPAPLAPMMPSAVPLGDVEGHVPDACTSRTARSPRPNRTMAFLNVGVRSKVVR